MKYCICVSGDLGKNVLNKLIGIQIPIVAVLTDFKSVIILDICRQNYIPFFIGNPRKGKALKWLQENSIIFENLISVNYLYILENDILNFASNVAINLHGSLLPKYRGRTPHVWAIINGEKETGISAHLMNEKCDDGDLIKQVHVDIEEDDTGATILQKYNKLYPYLICEIIEGIETYSLNRIPQDSGKATYFSKRSPEDGLINWNWQKERIRNWVRAQAFPYPGAFTYLYGKKIIINKVEYSDVGFKDIDSNGLVLDIFNGLPIVKVPNGTLLLVDFISDIAINKNDILK